MSANKINKRITPDVAMATQKPMANGGMTTQALRIEEKLNELELTLDRIMSRIMVSETNVMGCSVPPTSPELVYSLNRIEDEVDRLNTRARGIEDQF